MLSRYALDMSGVIYPLAKEIIEVDVSMPTNYAHAGKSVKEIVSSKSPPASEDHDSRFPMYSQDIVPAVSIGGGWSVDPMQCLEALVKRNLRMLPQRD